MVLESNLNQVKLYVDLCLTFSYVVEILMDILNPTI